MIDESQLPIKSNNWLGEGGKITKQGPYQIQSFNRFRLVLPEEISSSTTITKLKPKPTNNCKIAVYTGGDVEKNTKVISYAKNNKRLYNITNEYIDLEDGGCASKIYYQTKGYTIITFEEFERDYLGIQPKESVKTQSIPKFNKGDIVKICKTSEDFNGNGRLTPNGSITKICNMEDRQYNLTGKIEIKNDVIYYCLENDNGGIAEHCLSLVKESKTQFEKDDYIVTLSLGGYCGNCAKTNYCFKQRETNYYIRPCIDLVNYRHNGNIGLTFDKSKRLKDWRYATPEEIEEYDRLGKPYDVTTLTTKNKINEMTEEEKNINFVPKIGDWVYDLEDFRLCIGKVTKFASGKPYCNMWYSSDGMRKSNQGNTDHKLRLATEEEVNNIKKNFPEDFKDAFETKPEHKFKVGDWVVFEYDKVPKYLKTVVWCKSHILQIDHVRENNLLFNNIPGYSNNICGNNVNYFRFATSKEIESVTKNYSSLPVSQFQSEILVVKNNTHMDLLPQPEELDIVSVDTYGKWR